MYFARTIWKSYDSGGPLYMAEIRHILSVNVSRIGFSRRKRMRRNAHTLEFAYLPKRHLGVCDISADHFGRFCNFTGPRAFYPCSIFSRRPYRLLNFTYLQIIALPLVPLYLLQFHRWRFHYRFTVSPSLWRSIWKVSANKIRTGAILIS